MSFELRKCLACSPRTYEIASIKLDFPAPFGPTTAVKFWRSLKSTVCVPPKDLKPSISNFTMRPRGCSTSMSAIALFESLRGCFEHLCDRRRAGVAWLALCAAMRLCCDSRLRGSLSSWRHAGALRAHSLLYRSTAADQQRSWVVRRIYVAMRPS